MHKSIQSAQRFSETVSNLSIASSVFLCLACFVFVVPSSWHWMFCHDENVYSVILLSTCSVNNPFFIYQETQPKWLMKFNLQAKHTPHQKKHARIFTPLACFDFVLLLIIALVCGWSKCANTGQMISALWLLKLNTKYSNVLYQPRIEYSDEKRSKCRLNIRNINIRESTFSTNAHKPTIPQ